MVIFLFYTVVYLFFTILTILLLIKAYGKYFQKMCKCTAKLNNKVVIVTGGNEGIGLETASRLAKRGATVVIASRNVQKSNAAVTQIKEDTGNPNIYFQSLDLSKLSSVKHFVEEFNKTHNRLDILINNAGYTDFEQVVTDDGIEKVIQVNHVGPFYLTKLLLNKMEASKPSRIIFVASEAHKTHKLDPNDIVGKKPNNFWTRYCNSKLLNVLAVRALAKRLPVGVTVYAVHPGLTKSQIWDTFPKYVKVVIHFALEYFSQSVEECAQGSLHAALAPSLESASGKYFYQLDLAKTHPVVTDELAEHVLDETEALINRALEKSA